MCLLFWEANLSQIKSTLKTEKLPLMELILFFKSRLSMTREAKWNWQSCYPWQRTFPPLGSIRLRPCQRAYTWYPLKRWHVSHHDWWSAVFDWCQQWYLTFSKQKKTDIQKQFLHAHEAAHAVSVFLLKKLHWRKYFKTVLNKQLLRLFQQTKNENMCLPLENK